MRLKKHIVHAAPGWVKLCKVSFADLHFRMEITPYFGKISTHVKTVVQTVSEEVCIHPKMRPTYISYLLKQTDSGGEIANWTRCLNKCFHVVQSQSSWATKTNQHCSLGLTQRPFSHVFRYILNNSRIILWCTGYYAKSIKTTVQPLSLQIRAIIQSALFLHAISWNWTGPQN